MPSSPKNGFDKLARSYRWLEYLSFGPFLWRTRTALLPHMRTAQRALVLGDGDGRFTAAILRLNSSIQVCAVDASSGMLRQLQRRVSRQGDTARVQALHRDATQELPLGAFDLICTHFFLDCLTGPQCERLVRQVSAQATPECRWVVSEFAVPDGPLRVLAKLLVLALYAVFRGLTGLRVNRLPGYERWLKEHHWHCIHLRKSLGGILRAELWQRSADPVHPMTMRDESRQSEPSAGFDPGATAAPYPPSDGDTVLPFLPGGDPVPNPEPEQPSLGMPDPGIYEGTGGTASVEAPSMSSEDAR